MSVCAQTYGYCPRHGNVYAGGSCAMCAAEQQVDDTRLRFSLQHRYIMLLEDKIRELRETTRILEARIADLEGRR